MVFKSIYDLTIEKVYFEYKEIITNPENKNKIANYIKKMMIIIN